MKIRFVHVGLVIAAVLSLAVWMSGQERKATVARSLAEPATPKHPDQRSIGSSPQAKAYRARMEFERKTREFLRDAPTLDQNTRTERARELSQEIDRREKSMEFSAGEAVMLRIGLIQASADDDSERIRLAQEVVDHYREQTAAREAAYEAQQRNDAKFQEYKAQEAKIVAEVLAMQQYPGNMSRDDYLRLRLQLAREAIYGQ